MPLADDYQFYLDIHQTSQEQFKVGDEVLILPNGFLKPIRAVVLGFDQKNKPIFEGRIKNDPIPHRRIGTGQYTYCKKIRKEEK